MRRPRSRRVKGVIAAISVIVIAAVVMIIVYGPTDALRRTQSPLNSVTNEITMSSIAVTSHNVAYCNSTDPNQRLDLYIPHTEVSVNFPLVVFVHGGGWHSGGKNDPLVSKYGTAIVRNGMAFASVAYRLAPKYTFPTEDNDVSCALGYLYNHAARYHLDKTRIALFGDSAGGQLVAYANLADSQQALPWHTSLKGVVDMYGVSNLTDLPQGSHIEKVANEFVAGDAALASAASPVTYSPKSAVPMLLFHGTKDHNVPLSQSQELTDHLKSIGVPVTFVTVQNGGHGFGGHTVPSVVNIRKQTTSFFSRVLHARPVPLALKRNLEGV